MNGGAWWAAVHGVVTEQLHFHFSLSCIGEGNGNPLQCSCLENPRDGGAWWAAVYGVGHDWSDLAVAAAHLPLKLSLIYSISFSFTSFFVHICFRDDPLFYYLHICLFEDRAYSYSLCVLVSEFIFWLNWSLFVNFICISCILAIYSLVLGWP